MGKVEFGRQGVNPLSLYSQRTGRGQWANGAFIPLSSCVGGGVTQHWVITGSSAGLLPLDSSERG